jgi:hypothetical protein
MGLELVGPKESGFTLHALIQFEVLVPPLVVVLVSFSDELLITKLALKSLDLLVNLNMVDKTTLKFEYFTTHSERALVALRIAQHLNLLVVIAHVVFILR